MIVLFVVAVCVAAIMARARLVVVRVEGRSMEPTLRCGARVLVRRVRPDRLRCGQIAVLAWPDRPAPRQCNPRWLIKRVVAVPGDPVPPAHLPASPPGRTRVPAGSVVVLGDNTAASYDSRRAGYFPADALLGVVVRGMRS